MIKAKGTSCMHPKYFFKMQGTDKIATTKAILRVYMHNAGILKGSKRGLARPWRTMYRSQGGTFECRQALANAEVQHTVDKKKRDSCIDFTHRSINRIPITEQ